jgi:UDP-glucose 4-epimerase
MSRGHAVVIGDDFSLGSKENIERYISSEFDDVVKADLSTTVGVERLFNFCVNKYGRIDEIWHLAANSDIPAGVTNPKVDLERTFHTTFSLLGACNNFGVGVFNFASSSAVYGDWGDVPLTESLGPLTPISNYGAMKLASEAQICAAFESFLTDATIFRFPNVVGTPATHGVIFDFIRKLQKSPDRLDVLGNGTQQKSYLHVDDLVDAMIYVSNRSGEDSNTRPTIINIGNNDCGVSVKTIADLVRKRCAPDAKINFGSSSHGWVGDVPRFSYDTSLLSSLGWRPSLSSVLSVEKAIDQISDEFTKHLD